MQTVWNEGGIVISAKMHSIGRMLSVMWYGAWSAHRSVGLDAAACAANAPPATLTRARNAHTRLASGGRPARGG